MHPGLYLIVRLALWLSAVMVSVLPVILSDQVDLGLTIFGNFEIINNAKLFREFYFVVVPVAVLSLSTILDYLCRGFKRLSGTVFALTILALVFNIFTLGSGLVGFMKIPRDSVMTLNQLRPFSFLILYALIVSVGTEIGIAFNHR